MISHEEAKKVAYESLSRIENVRILSEKEAQKVLPGSKLDIWEVSTEVTGPDVMQQDVKLNLIFLPDFPLSLPKVILGTDDYEGIKYIPHVDVSRLVCTYDNQAQPDPDLPGEVVIETLRKAKRIIEEGINGTNKPDFDDEFAAYWEGEYSNKDTVLTNLLLLVEVPLNPNIKLISLENPANRISYVIHQEEGIARRFKAFLNNHGRKFKESQAFFLGNLTGEFTPPFDLTNKDVIELVKKETPESFDAYKAFLNSQEYPKLIMFSKLLSSEQRYFGWSHNRPKLNRNGFRSGSLTAFQAFSTFQYSEPVKRISPELFNSTRLQKRSSGRNSKTVNSIIYSIAGVGSIGSNLIHFLKSHPSAEFRLIDKEILKVENLGRHFLGFDYLNKNKAFGLEGFLKENNPTREVTARDVSIHRVVENEPEYVNESNLLIVCIGEENIEKWIASKLAENIIKIPILFVWVEPYLVGGHCVYITPNHNNYGSLFDENGLFKFNVISSTEYLSSNPALSSKEAGCQTNFTPYSADQVLSFLGALYPHISKIIANGEPNAKSFTWVGDKTILNNFNLQASDYGKGLIEGSINYNLLGDDGNSD
ncbi:hypothetical protein AWW67_07725 [Roseivirga seohaensis]|uniref:Uncharacterized protein n=1 Tax=Roseivirga seohaensis TaxID=1914963 RepID=A0A150XR59_9BACT|nr:E2/UBC family protein [Roseivirga seohaensis]KYG81237.1 hypothetical protein AWW67_07725 [Roseivirga seohaensis]